MMKKKKGKAKEKRKNTRKNLKKKVKKKAKNTVQMNQDIIKIKIIKDPRHKAASPNNAADPSVCYLSQKYLKSFLFFAKYDQNI